VSAEDNSTAVINDTQVINDTEQVIDNTTQPVINDTPPVVIEEEPDDTPVREEETLPDEVELIMMSDFVPKEFRVGDVQFNVKVKNVGTVKMENLAALVSGKGYSTYDVISIDSLKPDESSYIIVMGAFKERGNIRLTIRIGDFQFYQDVTVIDPSSVDDNKKLEEMKKAEQEKKRNLELLSKQLDDMEKNYTSLETALHDKKVNKYDVSEISLADLKASLRSARASLAVDDAIGAKASLSRAEDEFEYQKGKIESAQLIKRSFWDTVRNNLLLVSSTAGAILTLVAAYELLKKKKESISTKVVKVKMIFGKKKIKKSAKNEKKKGRKDKPELVSVEVTEQKKEESKGLHEGKVEEGTQ